MKIFNITFGLVLIFLLNIFTCPAVWTQENDDDVDEDATINDETLGNQAVPDVKAPAESDAEEEDKVTSSPYVSTNILFVKPVTLDFPAGKIVRLIVGFHNNGTSNFIADSIEASLRYPQDFQYHIQNFTVYDYGKIVEPEREATFEYAFTPSETFSSRPFGLVVNMYYRNNDGKQFINVLFNDTINIIEPDGGFDGETFFLYIFLVAIAILLVVIAQQFFSASFKKRITSKIQNVQKLSNGSNSNNNSDVDLEWIPKEHLQTNKSPRNSPTQRKTTRQRSTTGGSGSENESK